MRLRPRPTVAIALLLALAVTGLGAAAELDTFNHAVSATSTSGTVTFTTAKTSLMLANKDTSANVFYYRIFYWDSAGVCTTAAATTSSMLMQINETRTYNHNKSTEPGLGYCGFTYVTAPAETATLRYEAK